MSLLNAAVKKFALS